MTYQRVPTEDATDEEEKQTRTQSRVRQSLCEGGNKCGQAYHSMVVLLVVSIWALLVYDLKRHRVYNPACLPNQDTETVHVTYGRNEAYMSLHHKHDALWTDMLDEHGPLVRLSHVKGVPASSEDMNETADKTQWGAISM